MYAQSDAYGVTEGDQGVAMVPSESDQEGDQEGDQGGDQGGAMVPSESEWEVQESVVRMIEMVVW